MLRFMFTYLCVGAAGAAAVWFGLPPIHARVRPWIDQMNASRPSTIRHDVEPEFTAVDPASKPDQFPTYDPNPADKIRLRQPTPRPAVKPAPVRPAAAAQPAQPAAVQQPPEPPLERPRPARPGEPASWGIICDAATCFWTDGQKFGVAPGGVLVTCREYRDSAEGMRILANVADPGVPNAPTAPILIPEEAIVLYTSEARALSDDERRALKNYYALEAKIRARTRQMQDSNKQENPFKQAYVGAHQAHNASIDQAADLLARRDSATGGAKARIEDQLREMKHHQAQLKDALLAVQKKYREWKDAHPEIPFQPLSDPQIRAWTQEQKAISRTLGNLVS